MPEVQPKDLQDLVYDKPMVMLDLVFLQKSTINFHHKYNYKLTNLIRFIIIAIVNNALEVHEKKIEYCSIFISKNYLLIKIDVSDIC